MKNNFKGQFGTEFVDASSGASYGSVKPTGSKVVPLANRKNPGTGADWMQWALAGGGGVLAYNLAKSLIGDLPEKKNKSVWEKVLAHLIPLGAGAVGALGGYALGEPGQKKAASVKAAQETNVNQFTVLNGQRVATGAPTKWIELIATRAHEDGITMQEAAQKIIAENNASSLGWRIAAGASGVATAGMGGAAALKARDANLAAREAGQIKKNPLFPTQTEIGAHRNAVKRLTDRIASPTTSATDSALSAQRLRAVQEAFAPKKALLAAQEQSMAGSRALKAKAGRLGWLSAVPAAISVFSLGKSLYDGGDADSFTAAKNNLTEAGKLLVP